MTASSATTSGAGRPAVYCPFCGADETEPLALFGSQLLTEQWYCRACRTPFERIKDDEDNTDTAQVGRVDGGQPPAPQGNPR